MKYLAAVAVAVAVICLNVPHKCGRMHRNSNVHITTINNNSAERKSLAQLQCISDCTDKGSSFFYCEGICK